MELVVRPGNPQQAAVALSSSYLTHASDSVIEEVEGAVTSTTPPTSLLSTGTVTTSISTSSVVSSSKPPQTSVQPPTAPLQPDPGLAAAAAANNQISHPSISIGHQHHTVISLLNQRIVTLSCLIEDTCLLFSRAIF